MSWTQGKLQGQITLPLVLQTCNNLGNLAAYHQRSTCRSPVHSKRDESMEITTIDNKSIVASTQA